MTRLPWRHRHRDRDEAAAARQEAVADLAEIRSRRPEVERVSAAMKDHQRRDDFAVMIERALRGGRA